MDGSGYIAANGQAITEEMIDGWCEAYGRGEFPEGERTVGGVVHGRPPLSSGKPTRGVVSRGESCSTDFPVRRD
jgi:hypothetical protein